MTIDIIEELRVELRECVFTPAERKALEAQLAELIRQRNQPTTSGDASPADQRFSTVGHSPPASPCPLEPVKRLAGSRSVVEGLHHRLIARVDPTPVADHRHATEQSWL